MEFQLGLASWFNLQLDTRSLLVELGRCDLFIGRPSATGHTNHIGWNRIDRGRVLCLGGVAVQLCWR